MILAVGDPAVMKKIRPSSHLHLRTLVFCQHGRTAFKPEAQAKVGIDHRDKPEARAKGRGFPSLALQACVNVILLSLFLPAHARAAQPDHGLQVPPGFEVTQFADDKLAADIHCLTLDPAGRVVVSGRGYVRLLLDDDGNGKADRALDFAQAPRDGAMGLFWEGDSLYCVGDGGLRVYRDAYGAGRLRPSKLLFKCITGGEHSAHAVQRGPDGWMYFLCGDHAGITQAHATLPTSPIKDPISGCVLRFPPDFKGCEIVADGYRNAYGMDFGSDGELFTFDSDNERCVSLPWYEPTRCYHVHVGGHHGWRGPRLSATWRSPPYFLDVVAPVCTLGRGSPTGVVCYKHTQFPPRVPRRTVPARLDLRRGAFRRAGASRQHLARQAGSLPPRHRR